MKIYKIWSTEHDKCYIGSTNASLITRLSQHLYNFNNGISTSTCKEVFNLCLDKKSVKIELIENVESTCLIINRARESFYINSLYDESVNKRLKISR